MELHSDRRMVSVMFADVSGFTSLSEHSDPEYIRDLMNECFEILVPIVLSYGGTIDKFIGDEIMALFGAPIAHEDDPERALKAALEMSESIQEFGKSKSIEIDMHFGINTGLVVTGGIGSDGHKSYSVMGDTVNVASRLEDLSQKGEILVGFTTYRLTNKIFDFEVVDPVVLKGKSKEVLVYKLIGIKGIKQTYAEYNQIPLKGRQPEVDLLRSKIDDLILFNGGSFLIEGEAGIGKSRLVEEVHKSCVENGEIGDKLSWYHIRCPSYSGSTVLYIWRQALSLLIKLDDSAGRSKSDILFEYVDRMCSDSFDQVYIFISRFLDISDESNASDPLQSMNSDDLKHGTFRAIESLLKSAARELPQVFFFDDLQWADTTSMEFLHYFLEHNANLPLLLICTCRPESNFVDPIFSSVFEKLNADPTSIITLSALPTADCESIMDAFLNTSNLSPKVKCLVLEYSEGNPFYIEEILRSLKESGELHQDDDRNTIEIEKYNYIPLVDSINGILLANIDRLPPKEKEILRLASVIGRSFEFSVLEEIAEDPKNIRTHLDLLVNNKFLFDLSSTEYSFKHHLMQEAAYNNLLMKEREQIHHEVAEAYESIYSDQMNTKLEVILFHWERTNNDEKVIEYSIRVATRALGVGASSEAINHYNNALKRSKGLESGSKYATKAMILESMGDVYLEHLSQHDNATSCYEDILEDEPSTERKVRVIAKLGDIHTLKGNLERAIEHYQHSISLLQQLPPIVEKSRINARMAYTHILMGRYKEAGLCAQVSHEVSDQLNDQRGLADAYRIMGIISTYQGHQKNACRYSEQSIKIYRELNDLPRLTQVTNNAANSYRLIGQLKKAQEYLDIGLDLARRIGNKRDEALILGTLGEIEMDIGEWDSAVAHLIDALCAAEESDVVIRKIQVHRLLGEIFEKQNNLKKSLSHINQSHELCKETGNIRFLPDVYLSYARLYLSKKQFSLAREYLDRATEYAGTEPSHAFLGLSHQCFGHLYYHQNLWTDAVFHYEMSIEYLKECGLLPEVGKTYLCIASASSHADGQEGEDRKCQYLAKAINLFRKIQSRFFTLEAEKLKIEVGCG